MIKASVVLDSVSPHGHRLTTFKLRYPKFIHGEAKTHRIIRLGDEGGYELSQEVGFMDDPNLSRNASSSRAVPTWKLIAEVEDPATRATPVWWGADQGGMQAAVELTGTALKEAQYRWSEAAMAAAYEARRLVDIKAHKQLVNRILEPFTHINVVCTATEYMNFFGLRLDAAAQPEMRALAEAMWRAYSESVPARMTAGDWHLPFVLGEEWQDYAERDGSAADLVKVSVARCARVSYLSNDTGKRSTVEEDLKLYDRLLGSHPLHASPAEHQATPDEFAGEGWWRHEAEHGNFTGWRQYRKMLPGEALAALPAGYTEREKAQ